MKVFIRRATTDDAPSILQLQQAWSDEDIVWGFVPDKLDCIVEYVGGYCYVAEFENKLAGYAIGKIEPNANLAALPLNQPCMEIVDLYVIPSLRSHGIGSQLVHTLLDAAAAEGVTTFRLFSGTKDTKRITSFYERHGFMVVGVEMTRTMY